MPAEAKYTFSRPTDLPGIELLSVENCERQWKVFHTTYTVCTIPKVIGAAEWCYRGRHYTAIDAHAMFLEPGETHHNTRVTPPAWFDVLFIDPQLIANLAESVGLSANPHIQVPSSAHPALFGAFARFQAAQNSDFALLERQSLLTRAIELMLTHCVEKSIPRLAAPSRAGLYRARDYIHAHHAEPIELEQLARIAGLSRFHFLRAFAQQFGLPPHAYQNSLRIEKIRALLRAGHSATEIETGFADQSHLIRHFKRAWGVTPARYAAMVQR